MYKQPTNKHRVLAIKNKFENKTSTENETVENSFATLADLKRNNNHIPSLPTIELNIKSVERSNDAPFLPQQMFETGKRVVKRSEAFRRDKNSVDQTTPFQRNFGFRNSCRSRNVDDKIKLFDSTRLSNCSRNNNNTTHAFQKSGSLSKLTDDAEKEINSCSEVLTSRKASLESNITRENENVNAQNLDESMNDNANLNSLPNIDNSRRDTLEIKNSYIKINESSALLETFKKALNKPLPNGPAPKKPPRTFLHSPTLNCSVPLKYRGKDKINNSTNIPEKKNECDASFSFTKGDPKYMLDKLEKVLKNNKMRLRRQEHTDYTSEEECNDLHKSKNQISQSPESKCMPSFNCANTNWTSCINKNEKEGCTTTFSPTDASENVKKIEPVYAEPIPRSKTNSTSSGEQPKRNSLYYMSSPVLLFKDRGNQQNIPELKK